MLLLTADEVRRLYELVRDHHTAYMVATVGKDAGGVTQDEVDRLVRAGILSPSDAAALIAADPFGDAVSLALLRIHLEQAAVRAGNDPAAGSEEVNALSYGALHARIARDPIPLTPRQQSAIAWARERAAVHCRGIGDAVARDIQRIVDVTDRAARRLDIDEAQRVVGTAVEERRTWQQLRSDLGHASGDWAYDWDRVARTELQNAANEGDAARIAQIDGGDAGVARVPNPSACEDCERLYLDENGLPRVFTLAELQANGSNVGRKRKDWQPTLETVHPQCHCRTRWVPAGWRFRARPEDQGGGWTLRPGDEDAEPAAGASATA